MKKYIIVSLASLFMISCGNNSGENSTIVTEPVTEIIKESTVSIETIDTDQNAIIDSSFIDEFNTGEVLPPTITEFTQEEDVPDVLVDEIVEISAPEVIQVIKPDHTVWNNLLKKNVSPSGTVNYIQMKSAKGLINNYINQLQSFTSQSDWSRNEKLAYWINLYNAATVRLIVENYPVNSITDINGGKPWDKKVVTIGAKKYSLNQIENDIIRPKFNEPRIHFAVNCAAKSCPKLMNGAFLPEKLSGQLTKQAKSFINGSKNDIAANKVAISKIFEWYGEDFGASIIDYLNKYSNVKIEANTTIEYKDYNWDLNK